MPKRSLILGIGGQDGSFLADVLLARGDEVAGFYRHSSYDNLARISHVRDRVKLYRGDLLESDSVHYAVRDFLPDEIYNVADQDSPAWSQVCPKYQRAVTCDAVDDLLAYCSARPVRVFQPLSATMFGNAPPPQNETTPCSPKSPYAQEKASAWAACKTFRARGLHVSCGIMFNHDSPRRAPGYLLQDVCRQAVAVARGKLEAVTVDPLDTRVDVGYAREYMEAAVRMLSLAEPDDFCVGTGTAWTVGLMAKMALIKALGSERYAKENGDDLIRMDPARAAAPQPFYRADIAKARAAFGFAPKVGPGELIKMLVDHFRGQP